MTWYISGPHDCIVHASDVVLELACNGIKPLVVSITTDQMSLSRYLVLIPNLFCQECCVMAILWVQRDRVVTIPTIHHRLLDICWYLACQVERRLDWKGLPLRELVERLVVYCPTWIPIGLGCNHHSGQPWFGSIICHLL